MTTPFEFGTAASVRDPFSVREAMLGWVRDIAPYGIVLTDTDLIVRDWNQWLELHSGLSADEVVGRSLLELFPTLAERKLDGYFARALRGEVMVLSTALHRHLLPFPNPVRSAAGEYMLQTARIAPLPAGERIVGTVTIIEDVTQRESQATILQRQHEHDRLLSDALALLLRAEEPLRIVMDVFPRIAASLKLDVYFSYAFSPDTNELRLQSAAGVTPEVRRALAAVPLGENLAGQVALRRTPLIAANVQESTSRETEPARRLGLQSYCGFPLLIGDRLLGALGFGSYARREIAADEVEFLGKLTQYVAIAHDRAERERALRQAQHSLSQHASSLEAKVAERTARLHETIVQLESFSYTIAHDLRAPIRALNGYADILLGDFAQSLPREAAEILERLSRATLRLDALTRDLLKFSRIMRQDVPLSAVDLDQVIGDTIGDNPALQRAVEVRGPLGSVSAQRTLLQQCISNLFDNALKFAQPGRTARIRVRSETRVAFTPSRASAAAPMITPLIPSTETFDGPRVRLWIEDNGIGIPADAHEKIWGVFERLPTPMEVEGTGIGLAIVARAMQQMGGSCGVESIPGEGTRFWLEFALP